MTATRVMSRVLCTRGYAKIGVGTLGGKLCLVEELLTGGEGGIK